MPDWKSIVRDRIASLHLQPAAEADLVEELSQHVDDRYRELRSAGATEEEALRAIVSELDIYPLRTNLQKLQPAAKHDTPPPGDTAAANFWEDLGRDLRYAFRTVAKSPGFAVFVVLTLALGIGANTTVFTVINTLILNPLPVPNSAGLIALNAAKNESKSKSSVPVPLSYPELKDYQSGNTVFRTLAGYTSPRGVTWQADTGSRGMFAELVTGNYFSALGIEPARGRFFRSDEDSTPGAHPVAVMSFGAWQSRFGGADVMGKVLRINNVAFTVIGVGPPQFIGVNAIFGPDLWIPATMAEQLWPIDMRTVFSDRAKALFQAVGRLKPALTQNQAQADISTVAANLAREYPATNEGRSAIIRPVRDVLLASTSSTPNQILLASAGLLIVVGIVLLIACSNVANLLLARSASRRQEIAIRLALGANRRRLVRQLLTESVFLASLGGLVGLGMGYGGLRLLFSALPSSANFIAPKLDATVFVFVLLVSVATGIIFGIVPALKTSGVDVTESLKEETRTMGRSRSKVTFANALLVGQVAFSFLLLVTANLFLRSIGRAYEIDPGFQTAHLAVFITNPGQAGYSEPQTKAFYKAVRERVAPLPEVESVSWASNLPLWARSTSGLQIEGRSQRFQAERISMIVDTVDLDFFNTAGVAIDSGRAFSNLDQKNSIPVAIVNEKLAHDYWPEGKALGKRIQLPGEKKMRQIVGIARTANYTNWAEPPQACVYVPLEQNYSDAMTLYVRSKGDPRNVLTPVERELRAAAPKVAGSGLLSVRTGRQIIDGGLFFAKAGVVLLSVFGLLALGLACIGLYGILAYAVNQRKREIGLRMALGAAHAGVLRLILKEGMSLVMTGVLIGLVAALFIGHLLSRMLFGISGSDPVSVAGAAVVLVSVAFMACYLPAHWASRVDPLVALREG